jgi:hypothetical protein
LPVTGRVYILDPGNLWLRKKSICPAPERDCASPSSLRRTPRYVSRGRLCLPGPAKRGRAFYEAISLTTFCEIIKFGDRGKKQ